MLDLARHPFFAYESSQGKGTQRARLRLCAAPAVSFTCGTNAAQTGGATVTVGGLNFASIDPSATASLELDVPCSSASWTSTTTVACAAASYGLGTSRSGVTVGKVVTTLRGQFSFDGTLPAMVAPA
jgi:hypothetical protein